MAGDAPLLNWRRDAELARIADERSALIRRISNLPPMSHRRVKLTARLEALTADALRLEMDHDHATAKS